MNRQEQINKVQELLSSGLLSENAKKALIEDFPELAESEDERILNALITHISIYEGDFKTVGVTRLEMLDWLERLKKQKEQKPVDPSDDELQRHQDELYDFKVFAAKQAKEHHISFVHDFEWNNFCAEILSYFNKQQKPAEWSLTDATFIEEIDETLFMAETGRNEVVKNQIERERNWLKSLPERFNLQPKQEWSDKDESYLQTVINEMEANKKEAREYEHKKYDTIILWLNSLRSRPKSSDNWKPSEEQIRRLNNVIITDSRIWGVETKRAMKSLYEDLKKL